MSEEHRINIMQEPSQQETVSVDEQPAVASVAERLIALLIDVGIIFIIYCVFLAILFRIKQFELETVWILMACGNLVFIFYETVWNSGGRNTLGRTLIGIRVVNRQTNEPLGIGRAFVRAVGYYISAILLMCGFFLAFIDDKHRALHDYLAGSVVIQARYKDWLEKTALALVGTLLMFSLAGWMYKQLFGAGSLSQQLLISRAQQHVEKIAYLEQLHHQRFGYYTNDLLRLSILSGDPVQFQRDTHKVLDRKDFRIGVSFNNFKIKARAKDQKRTPVYYPNF